MEDKSNETAGSEDRVSVNMIVSSLNRRLEFLITSYYNFLALATIFGVSAPDWLPTNDASKFKLVRNLDLTFQTRDGIPSVFGYCYLTWYQ